MYGRYIWAAAYGWHPGTLTVNADEVLGETFEVHQIRQVGGTKWLLVAYGWHPRALTDEVLGETFEVHQIQQVGGTEWPAAPNGLHATGGWHQMAFGRPDEKWVAHFFLHCLLVPVDQGVALLIVLPVFVFRWFLLYC